jgi:4-hydroxybenzoate polyprenyltransferase
MPLRTYLRLIRLPNVLTAAADGLAGWLIAGGALDRPDRWGLIALASMAVYAGGIVLNDLCDLELDRVERPERPLPSGAVSISAARALAAILLSAGPLLAWAGGGRYGLAVGTTLTLAVVAYDASLRRTPLGPLAMGSCRALNLLMGVAAASVAPDLAAALGTGAAYAFGYGLFVAGLTWTSRAETSTGRSASVAFGLAVQNAALILIAALMLRAGFVEPAIDSDPPRIRAEALLLLALIALAINSVALAALAESRPATVMRLVKTSILSLVWIDVAFVIAARGIVPALAVAALGPPAAWLARRIAAT